MEQISHYGNLNISLGWITMVLGILSGSIIGLWAFAGPFKPPKGHEDYANLSRRMVRLAHIAMFMLPLISIVYGQHLDQIPLSDSWKLTGAWTWIVCMLGVPSALIAASFQIWFKYVASIPVTCGIVALCIMAYGQFLLI